MGAHLSTIQAALREQFARHDGGGKGYLTLKEVLALQPQYGINPCHVGVLHAVDRNLDGRFTLDELHAFAAFAHAYSRSHRGQEGGFMLAGYASLKLWAALRRDDDARADFVDWAMRLFCEGYDTLPQLPGVGEPVVHRKALKALHALFDMERNLGVDYQALLAMVRDAAGEQQLLHLDEAAHDKWVPLEVLRLFTEAVADGMCSIMESFATDDAELEEVLTRVQSAVAAAAAEQQRRRLSSTGGGSGGSIVTPLNLKRSLVCSAGV